MTLDHKGIDLIERALAVARVAKHEDAPFPLDEREAGIWHEARVNAFNYCLEVLNGPAPSGQAPLEGVKAIPAWTIAKGVEIPQWLEKVTVRGTGTLRLVAGSDLLVAELADGFDVRAQNPWYREALFVGEGEANDVLIEGGGNGVNLRAVYDIEKPSYHGDILPIVKSALEGWTIDDGTEYQFEQCAEAVAQAIRSALLPASVEPVACGLANPGYQDCKNMKEVGGGMEGERYRCSVCGKGYFLDYEDMK